MCDIDDATGKSRGYLILSRPALNSPGCCRPVVEYNESICAQQCRELCADYSEKTIRSEVV